MSLISFRLLEGRGLLTLLLLGAVAWSLTSVPWSRDILHPGGARALAQILGAIFSLDLSPPFLRLAAEAAWTTVAYAVAGMTLALGLGLPLGILSSGVLAESRWARWASVSGVRFILGSLRSVHELVWAWLFVVAIGFSPIAAVLALALPYSGILGRIFAEVLNDVRQEPLSSLRSSGASELKVLLYGRLPMALPDMASYAFYRFECAIRSAAIFSFVGIAGLGYQIQLSLDDLLYGQVWTLLLFLVGLVALVDLWSSAVRRRLVS